jgi:phosphopantetheine adenylyltransferase
MLQRLFLTLRTLELLVTSSIGTEVVAFGQDVSSFVRDKIFTRGYVIFTFAAKIN